MVYKLLEGSWEDDAVIRDRERHIFSDPNKVHPINHQGTFSRCRAFTCVSRHHSARRCYIRRVPPAAVKLLPRNMPSACLLPRRSKVLLRKTVADIRRRAEEAGRDPRSILIFNMQTVIVGETDKLAQAKWQDYKRYVSHEGALALISGWTGIDFSQYQPDQVFKHLHTDAIQSVVESFSTADPQREWTVQNMADWVGIGGFGPLLVGSTETVADELQSWVEETDVDGFNLAYAVTHETLLTS